MSDARVIRDSEADLERWTDPLRGNVGFWTIFGPPEATTPDFTAGVTELEPGGWLGHHRHDPSELYFCSTARPR